MSIEPTTSVRPALRSTSSIRNLAIALLAAIPIAACSSGAADEPTAADSAEATTPTRPTDEPSPTVTEPSTLPAQALFGESSTLLEPGTYFVNNFDGTTTPRVHLTIGPGWTSGFDGWAISSDTGFITFSRPDAVLADACHPSDGYHPGPMTTLDGLVAALSEQKGWTEVSTPSDISIDGYAGKAFQRSTPADVATDCPREYAPPPAERILYPQFPSWENTWDNGGKGWSYYGPGDTETLWVLDLDGTIVILSARLATDEPAAAHAEIAAVLDSIRIDRD